LRLDGNILGMKTIVLKQKGFDKMKEDKTNVTADTLNMWSRVKSVIEVVLMIICIIMIFYLLYNWTWDINGKCFNYQVSSNYEHCMMQNGFMLVPLLLVGVICVGVILLLNDEFNLPK